MSMWKGAVKLKVKLAILMSVLSVASIVIISSSVFFLWTEQIKTSVYENLYDNAKTSVEKIERILTFERQNLLGWSQLDIMIDVLSNDTDLRIHSAIDILKQNYQLKGELIVYDIEGNLIASTTNEPQYLNYLNLNKIILTNDLKIQFPSIKNINSDVIMIIPIIIKQLSDEPSGYMILTHPFSNLLDVISESLPSFELADKQYAKKISNRDFNSTVHPLSSSKTKNKFTADKKSELLTNWIELDIETDNPLKIRGVEQREKAFSLVYQTMWLILKITIFMVVIIIGIALFSAKRFVTPIIELQEFTQNIASSGRMDLAVPVRSHDEIGKLAMLIQKMMTNLDSAFKDNERTNTELTQLTLNLENRVTERTKELSSVIDQLKHAQSQLVQSEKMNSLGQLVAGIAHELNNPISAINTNIPILDEYFSDMASVIESLQKEEQINLKQLSQYLEDIDYDYISEDIHSLLKGQSDSAERIRDIVLSLRNFSRLDEGELKQVDIHQGLDSTINILRHETKDRIEIHRDYQLSSLIECYPGEINQVFMNILSNACQSIENEGNIYIETKLVDGDSAEIIIRDDGAGISDDVIAKLFDPFFTTKPIGTGTGLGLSISYNIIENHQGSIEASNADPHGAIFTVRLPLIQSISNDK